MAKNDRLFELIAQDLEQRGYSVRDDALPESLSKSLHAYQQSIPKSQYHVAGVGRKHDHLTNTVVRSDDIYWINGGSTATKHWLKWVSNLQDFLNRRLFLGLFSFESHFAHYAPGDYYKRHCDAFRGDANRVLSLVTYLNPKWRQFDGGELILYSDEQDQRGFRISPNFGTLVVFLSEEFPHEVLPASRDRYSIAGWFRLNTSINNNIDPPR